MDAELERLLKTPLYGQYEDVYVAGRLVLGDWYEDHGRPVEAALARAYRVTVYHDAEGRLHGFERYAKPGWKRDGWGLWSHYWAPKYWVYVATVNWNKRLICLSGGRSAVLAGLIEGLELTDPSLAEPVLRSLLDEIREYCIAYANNESVDAQPHLGLPPGVSVSR